MLKCIGRALHCEHRKKTLSKPTKGLEMTLSHCDAPAVTDRNLAGRELHCKAMEMANPMQVMLLAG